MNRIDFKIFILKYNQVRLVPEVFASTKLALNYIKQVQSN